MNFHEGEHYLSQHVRCGTSDHWSVVGAEPIVRLQCVFQWGVGTAVPCRLQPSENNGQQCGRAYSRREPVVAGEKGRAYSRGEPVELKLEQE